MKRSEFDTLYPEQKNDSIYREVIIRDPSTISGQSGPEKAMTKKHGFYLYNGPAAEGVHLSIHEYVTASIIEFVGLRRTEFSYEVFMDGERFFTFNKLDPRDGTYSVGIIDILKTLRMLLSFAPGYEQTRIVQALRVLHVPEGCSSSETTWVQLPFKEGDWSFGHEGQYYTVFRKYCSGNRKTKVVQSTQEHGDFNTGRKTEIISYDHHDLFTHADVLDLFK